MSEKLIPDAATSNPHPGRTQAYLATEYYNEGWNACREEMLARQEVAMREQPKENSCVHEADPKSCYRVRCQLGGECVDDSMSPRATQLAKHLRYQAQLFREMDPKGRGAKELEEAASLLKRSALSHAEIAAAATQACLCRTGADGWIFENTTQLQKFLCALK